MASCTEGLSESHRSSLLRGQPGRQALSKLEMLKNEYQERALREKEQKMLKMLRQQRERNCQRINGYSATPAPNRPPEEKIWASNWTVAKRTSGVDRAHPLQPLRHRNVSNLQRAPSATSAGIRHAPPHVRSKSGPSQTDYWQELEKSQSNLEAEIRRKESVLREKLRRTEEELRRLQTEKKEAEPEERRAGEIQDAKTRPRRTVTSLKEGGGRPPSIEQHGGGRPPSIEQHGGGRPPSIEQHGGGRPPSIEQHGGGRPPSIEQHGGGRPPSIEQHGGGRPPSIEQHGGGRPPSIEQHGGGRVKPAVQGAPLTHVLDAFHQLRLVTPGAPSTGRPSSQQVEEGALLGVGPQSPGQQLVPCLWCGRRFTEHRLQRHRAVCERTHGATRKVFDSSKARAKGTDLEQYLHKGRAPAPQVREIGWRQKHESFLRTIRQARVVQDVVARGGKISDLPPHPPQENPDYVACPHCSRRFAPRAAERHIPKCENIKSRPRPPPSRRR
ncbi:uncharacterized protein LOC142710028 [Rhinoderma darwinii]|uniref:uncharacterized protein LOC142710028 n=1 Tax=Rhinoderma darwinii TaxID=43563 RepID=UPI003F67FD4F